MGLARSSNTILKATMVTNMLHTVYSQNVAFSSLNTSEVISKALVSHENKHNLIIHENATSNRNIKFQNAYLRDIS